MKVTRITRTRYLAAVRPGSPFSGCAVRIAATRGERTLRAENSFPASPGLAWLTVTEMRSR